MNDFRINDVGTTGWPFEWGGVRIRAIWMLTVSHLTCETTYTGIKRIKGLNENRNDTTQDRKENVPMPSFVSTRYLLNYGIKFTGVDYKKVIAWPYFCSRCLSPDFPRCGEPC